MPANKVTILREKRRQRYLAKRDEILAKRKADRKEMKETHPSRAAAARTKYAANPEPRKAASKTRYMALRETYTAAFRSRYRANAEASKTASGLHYKSNTEACKAASRLHYKSNTEACKAASRSHYKANTEAYKTAFRLRYRANTEACKTASRYQYRANTEACKTASRYHYRANTKRYKAAFTARYQASREQIRASYLLNSAKKRAASGQYYSYKHNQITHQRRGRYALKEPNADMRQQYTTELKCSLIANSKVKVSLSKAFTAKHKEIAQTLSRTGLTIAACRVAAQKVLTDVLKVRKYSAGKLLGSIAKINELDINHNELGDQVHCASSEPYFYQTAYAPVKRESGIPVNEFGQCVVADEVLDKDGNSYRRRRWKCTVECKHPTTEEVTSICCVKMLFRQPMQQLREGLEDLDTGCPHVHRLLPPPAYPSDDEDDEVHAPPMHVMAASDSHEEEWMGHPFPCTMDRCGSQLRTLRAAAVHYPLLRRFLYLLYQARMHHRIVLNIDAALCSCDFQKLMTLIHIDTYHDLYKDGKGKSGSGCENSIPVFLVLRHC